MTAVDLSGNELFIEAIKELVKLSWPRLEKLDLSWQTNGLEFDPAIAAYLVKEEWPLLKSLDFSSNNESVPVLVKDTSRLAWPAFKHLSVSGGAINDLGIAELTMGKVRQSGHLCALTVCQLKLL